VELRRARTKANLTQKDVAQALDWSPSKVIRIESGQVAISTTDLRALLSEYGVTDGAVVSELVDLARNSKKQPWSQYKDVLRSETQAYFGFESSASIIRQVEPLLIPGLLQTEAYTRAMLVEVFDLPPRWIDRTVEARLARQETLTREDVSETFFIIDEAVIRRTLGGAEVMRAQLQRLLTMAERPTVTLQVLPFRAGGHQGLQGPFVLMEFGEAVEMDDDSDEARDSEAEERGDVEADNFVLYLEGREGALIRDKPELMGEYLERFFELEKRAATAQETTDLLKKVIKEI
jgi:transcriptional regulator with XRE-family HTH domain